MDNITKMLVSPLPREVMASSPVERDDRQGRRLAFSIRHIESFIMRNSGVNNCWFSVYPVDETVDRLSHDYDGRYATRESQAVYHWLVNHGFPAIPTISGLKGTHIHILLKPDFYDMPKSYISAATYGLLRKVLGEESKSIDKTKVGDIRQMSRIPNTLRPPENNNWCTYLPEYFDKMTESEVAECCKQPNLHPSYYLSARTKTLFDLPMDEIEQFNNEHDIILSSTLKNYRPEMAFDVIDPIKFLEGIMRPCLFRQIQMSNPPHHVRVATVVDLLNLGLSEQEVYSAISKLGWRDFDQGVTKYHIKELSDSNMKPYSCRKLRQLGVPQICCIR